ncbi:MULTISPECIES: NAD-glutamate dehydrogenase [Rhizobium]|uniref:NAD-glutamate dehydrogenase n=1 Tax=Rhizobium rhododendri TaxID=2506430 RepID=A0ABY8INJ5_9HYPH|nr:MULTISPECIES: NAD-glutamate dehydrogenase [Rhizobium]MBZ5760624.1 NAD-glutamate dehydrogenase [Rhizobium sp. VS19-DR96]MBZ5765592.1 NAD-glutamate dehydrogenase [Rhizobium sp. VS19-DR129.2]MBZ5774511.1 NAD-glutamate dehydrogenase [Rhizobium sp. VS19-DRK62.2]MBZ5784459.1 NAD-glutamate dehydrogenase [Rhizobium sp. VS19-DR121]MBZ5801071.1 NAD-glutamate dehydrogenase [Rhizobium sp. VS19-DR181]
MMARMNPKREKLIEAAVKAAEASGKTYLDPKILFGQASNDDMARYSAEMLALTAIHTADELGRWSGEARITVAPIEGVAPGGVAVSVLSITDRNMPFLYESVMGEVTSTYRDVAMAVHPILSLQPDGTPALKAAQAGDPGQRVSHIQLHLAPLTAEQADALIVRVRTVLEQTHLSVGDWQPMLARLDTVIDELSAHAAGRRAAERDEALAFLSWLRDDNFTFLGMRDYVYSGKGKQATVERDRGTGLGILANPDVRVLRQGSDAVTTTPEILAFLDGPDFLIVTKANVKSLVHRRAYMDYVGVKRFDEKGNVVGELRIVGLFTSIAYTAELSDIPLLRAKAQKVTDHFGFDPTSHSGRMLQNTLESYPRDDLFQIDTSLLATFCEQINDLADRPRVRVLPRIDHFDRFVSVIVYVPREEYDSVVREKIGAYLRTVYDGRVSAYYPAFPEGGVARVHFIIGRTIGRTPHIAQAVLEDAVRAIAARWIDRLEALAGPAAPGLTVSQAFQEAFSPEETAADLPAIMACAGDAPIRIGFYRRSFGDTDVLSLKIFHGEGNLALSRRVPLLENLGFNVLSERTFDIHVEGSGISGDVVLHDMELEARDGVAFDLKRHGAALEEAFLAAFEGSIDNDVFNRLIVSADLTARTANILRAYARYLRQAGIAYSQDYIATTLDKYPAIAASIVRLFHDSLDPTLEEKPRLKRLATLHAAIETDLASVPSLDDDRILRRYVNAVDATLRTNYFQRSADGSPKAMFAIKLDPKQLDGLPEPRPFREIFVYGVEVEGVHLRFGKVARGGLRWSDRAEDYRTEVLGLVKAQQVKNAVIVPVGAKGGFYPKQLPAGGSRDAIFNVGREAYKTYIRTLLSITDNISGADIIPPPDTLRLDGDDPYFVVAADKGTATFSDTANGLAQEAGFWLDDAFASGGSAGYDHKKMGITARGAWETVKRHFRELDIDIQTTPFSVVGVGDMSGDVFGNGMLLSPKIRLIAAFDHRDIVIDPDPDMAATLAERQRLFDLPRSSWQDFDKSLLSAGGMIIPRSAKSVTLTREAAAAIGLDRTVATPFEIITAILKCQADLLWFGGIGTYVKSPTETDADVGDRANDPIRINADEVRARVIGEGANLGVTQKGRIAYCLKGGRCNSDAIDNSAGVNTSDVEVNIKIALASAMQDGRLTRARRDQLLASMTSEVAALVLRNNYLQSLAISLTERKGTGNGLELGRFISVLESARKLSRKVETLPDEATFAERYANDRPLTRPEIGVLLSYAKIVLFDALLESALPDDPYFAATLTGYFPQKMHRGHAADIAGHRLRREIVATSLANEAINRGGPAFVVSMMDATAAAASEVVKAAVLARDGFDLDRLWDSVDGLDGKIGGEVQNRLYGDIGQIYTVLTRLLLKTSMVKSEIGETVGRLQAAAKKLRPLLSSRIPAEFAAEIDARRNDYAAAGVPEGLAGEIAALGTFLLVPDVMQIAEQTGEALARAAETYFEVSQTFRVSRLLVSGSRIVTGDHYENLALARSLDRIATARRDIVISALNAHPQDRQPLAAWHASDRIRINRIAEELAGLSEGGEANLARITVAAGLLGDLAHDLPR